MKKSLSFVLPFVVFGLISTASHAASQSNKKASKTIKTSEAKKKSSVKKDILIQAPQQEEVKEITAKTSGEEESISKTQGHFINLDVVYTRASFNERFTRNTSLLPTNTKPHYQNEGYGAAISYKYAMNYKGIFLAPGVFAEHNGTQVNGTESNARERLDIEERFGVKADLGYDVTSRFAPFITGGYGKVKYTTKNFSPTRTFLREASNHDWYYGAGVKIRLNDSWSLNAEYNRQSFLAKTLVVLSNPVAHYLSYYKTTLDIGKVGLSYNF